jgi:hypothetical protein
MVLPWQVCLNLDLVLLMCIVLQALLDSLPDFLELLLGEHRLESVLDLLDVREVPLLGHHEGVLVDGVASLLLIVALGQVQVSEEALVESLTGGKALVLIVLDEGVIFIGK